MIAYVYFASGNNIRKKLKVPVGDIKKFDPSNVKPKKLYEVKCGQSYERALIIHVADTEELLDALIDKKRSVIPPQSQLLSPSDSSFDESSQPSNYNAKPRYKMSSIKKKENLQELLDKKMRNLKSSQSNSEVNEHMKKVRAYDQCTSHTSETVLKEINGSPNRKKVLVGKNTDVSKNSHSTERNEKPKGKENTPKNPDHPIHFNLKQEIVELNGKGVTAENLDVFKKPALSIGTAHSKLKEKNGASDERQVDTSHIAEKEVVYAHDAQHKKDCDMTKSAKPKILTIAKVHNESECSRNVISLSEENNLLRTKVTDLQQKIKDQNLIIKELTQLNMELQKCVISHFDELKATVTRMASAEASQLGNARNFPPVGYVRKADKMMHLRRGEWLPKNIYDSDVINAKNSSGTFTRNLCRSVFGEEVLLHSTLTGCGSNRKREGKLKYPKLDENKLLAIHDTFKFWALNDRKPVLSEVKALLELSRVNGHISQKIADLKRLVAKTPGHQKKRNDETKKEKNQNKKDEPCQTLNEGRPSSSKQEGNPAGGAEELRKEKRNDGTNELNNRTNKDKPRQTLNEGRPSTSKHEANLGGDAEELRKEKRNDDVKSKKNMNRKDESKGTLNKDRPNEIECQENQESKIESDIISNSDSEWPTGGEELRKETRNDDVKSKKNMNRKDESNKTLNKDRPNEIECQENQESQIESDIISNSDSEWPTGGEELRKETRNDDVKSKTNMNRKDESNKTLNKDRPNEIECQENQESQIESNIIPDSDSESLTDAEKLREENTDNYGMMINQVNRKIKEERVQESKKVSREIEHECHQSENDTGSSTTDMSEEEINDSEYSAILMDNEHLCDSDNDNEVDVPKHNPEKNKKYQGRTQPTNRIRHTVDEDSDNSDYSYSVDVLLKESV